MSDYDIITAAPFDSSPALFGRDDSYGTGLENLATGMGQGNYDPMQSFQLGGMGIGMSDQTQIKLAEEGFLRKAIWNIPNACTRAWGTPQLAEGDDRIIRQINEELDDIPCFTETDELSGVRSGLNEAMAAAFLTGNAAFIIEADDGKEMFEPLDLANLRSIAAFHVLDRWSATPDRFGRGPTEFYRVNSSQQSLLNGRVHASRVFWLHGMARSPRAKIYAGGFDASILESIAEPYLAYKSAITNASRMLQDYDVIFHQIKDLGKVSAAACKGDKAAQAQLDGIKEVLRISHKSKSIFRSYVGDKDNESFENITRNVGGYRDIADFVKEFLPACSEFPPAILFGEFAGTGLGSGSKSTEDKELWNEVIRNAQTARLSPLMTGMPSRRHKQSRRPPGILNLICAQKDGPFKGRQPEGLAWDWNDLYPQTTADKAATETAWAGVLATVGAFDPRFTGQFILSRFANADSPIVLSPEYVETLRDEAAKPVDPNAVPPPEELPTEDAPVTDSADSPIVANMRTALSMPRGGGMDFSPSALRVARSVVSGARMTEDQQRSCRAWMDGKKRYAKMPKGHPQHTAWLLRGGDEGYKSYGGRP